MSIWKIIKAEYLINENARTNWLFVIMLVLMGMVIINLGHSADEKVKHIVKLKKEVDALRSEYVELKAQVMQRKMATKVYNRLKEKGFEFPKNPPVKIKLSNE
jgi:hypothetical protein